MHDVARRCRCMIHIWIMLVASAVTSKFVPWRLKRSGGNQAICTRYPGELFVHPGRLNAFERPSNSVCSDLKDSRSSALAWSDCRVVLRTLQPSVGVWRNPDKVMQATHVHVCMHGLRWAEPNPRLRYHSYPVYLATPQVLLRSSLLRLACAGVRKHCCVDNLNTRLWYWLKFFRNEKIPLSQRDATHVPASL